MGMAERVHGRGPVKTRRIQEEPSDVALEVGRDSVALAERVFTGLYVDLVTQLPVVGDAHPEFPQLTVERKRIQRTKGGRGKATLYYTGPDPALGDGLTGYEPDNEEQNITEPVITIDTEEVEVPIETHPDFSNLVSEAGEGEGQATFDENGLFLGFGPNSGGGLAGVQTYSTRLTVRTEEVLSLAPLNPNDVATLDGGAFVSRVSSQTTGTAWKNTRVTKEGLTWNPLIYS